MIKMDFNMELTEFPSVIHKVIYFSARSLVPTEKSLTWLDDGELRRACEAYHSFFTALLSDMYDCPEAYHLPVLEYENCLGGKSINYLKRTDPATAKRIISNMRNSVHGYMVLLCILGYMGVPDGSAIKADGELLKYMEKRTKTPASPISLQNRLKALSRVGLTYADGEFTLSAYPDAFSALIAMAKTTGGKFSGFAFFNFCNAEFRALSGAYKPGYEDYYRPLIDSRRSLALSLHNMISENKGRTSITTFWKVNYKYKNAQLMCIDSADGDVIIHIVGVYKWNDSELVNSRLRQLSAEEQKFALRHLWRCTFCSDNHIGQLVRVLDKPQRVCGAGLIGFEWRNPKPEELDDIWRYIKLRMDIIDEIG